MMEQTTADVVLLERGDGTSVTVHLFGGTVTSWKYHGQELLFVSSKSLFDKKKAIRGGIPVVFPNFGPWELGPQHGFARIQTWTLSTPPTVNSDGDICAELKLEDNEVTQKMWKHKFCLMYKLLLGENTFSMTLSVENKGDTSFSFTWLLHTYLGVPDITKAAVKGLTGLHFVDKVAGNEAREQRDLVTVAENVDRVYTNTPDEHVVEYGTDGGAIIIKKDGFPDTVVWNPWQEKAAAMSDFGDDEYPKMLCVEAGLVAKPQDLPPGGVFSSSQQLRYKAQL